MPFQDFGLASWARQPGALDAAVGAPLINATGIRYKVGSPAELRALAMRSNLNTDQGQFDRAILGSMAQQVDANGNIDVAPGQTGFDKSQQYGAFALKEAGETPLLADSGASQTATGTAGARTGASLGVLSRGGQQPAGRVGSNYGQSFSDPAVQQQVQQVEQARQGALDRILGTDIGAQAGGNLSGQDVRQALTQVAFDPNFAGNLQTNLAQRQQQNALAGAGGAGGGFFGTTFDPTFWRQLGLQVALPALTGGAGTLALAGAGGALQDYRQSQLQSQLQRQTPPVQPASQVDFSDDFFSHQRDIDSAFPGMTQPSASELMSPARRPRRANLGGYRP